MRMITAAQVVLFGTQTLPTELQVSQLEDPRVRDAGIVIIGGQNPVITNTQRPQLPATQLEQRSQTQGLNATFDVNFRDAVLLPVLTTLAQYAGLNLVISPDVTGTVTVDLKAVTLRMHPTCRWIRRRMRRIKGQQQEQTIWMARRSWSDKPGLNG